MAKRASSPVATLSQSFADTLLMIAEAEEMRRSLKQFVINAWRFVDPAPFVDGWCIDAICEHLTALSLGQIRFLLINIPPRHSKSTICSVLWPVWGWLQNPAERFLSASYSLDLSTRDNLKKRNLIDSQWFQERYGQDFNLTTDTHALEFTRESDFSLSKEQNAKRFFMNNKLGYQMATSVASSATGHGGSILIIDDVHAADEAHSDVERESANVWFRETWSNRMNDANKDKMLVVGQRIHEEDTPGIILKERPDWVHLNLPAEYESNRKCFTSIGWEDPRKEEGELLWPERFNPETLTRYKRDLGPVGYAAQYQQSPTPSSGAVFYRDSERLFTMNYDTFFLHTPKSIMAINKDQCSFFMTVDPAISEKQSSDYTVIQKWAKTPFSDILLIDLVRGHWGHNEQQKEIEEIFNDDENIEFIAVETVAYQHALFQDLVLKGIPCNPFKPSIDKVSRAGVAAIWQSNGKMYFLKGASWLEDFQNELYKFPKARKDDQVDATSLAAIVVRSRGPLSDDDGNYGEIPDPIEGPPDPHAEIVSFPITQPIINDSVPVQVVIPVSKPVDAFSWADRKWGENW